MNLKLHPSTLVSCLSLLATATVSYAGGGSSIYLIQKNAIYIQQSSSSASLSGNFPYEFRAQGSPSSSAIASNSLTIPQSSSPLVLPYDSNDQQDEFDEKFTTKAALDAAFPDGSYTMTGGSLTSGITFPLTSDSYPATVPSITSVSNGSSGTWSNNVLFIDPTQAATINLSPFSSYASTTAPVIGGHMSVQVQSVLNGNYNNQQEVVSITNTLGLSYQATPNTSYAIPASTLTAGDILEMDLQYDSILRFDDTTISGAGIVSLFENDTTIFIVAAAAPTVSPPVFSSNLPSAVTGIVGGSVTLPTTVTVGGNPISGNYATIWLQGGLSLSIGGKYVENPQTTLTINSLAASDAGTYFLKVINEGGLVTSSEETVTVLPADAATAPVISSPSGTTGTVNTGSALNLSVTASDVDTTLALTYQWQLNSTNISGATSSTYSVASLSTANTGDYSVIVSNGYATATHDFGTLTVNPFTLQPPTALTLQSGRSLALNVIASGASAATYQWYFNSNVDPLSGATDPVLEVKNTTSASAGNYYCVVTIGGVHYTSTSTALTVTTSSSPAYLSALSTRGDVGTGNNILIGGFAINGSGTKTLLLRAVGPALVSSLPQNEILASTQLALYDVTGHPIVTDAGWNNTFTPGTSAVVVDPVAATATFIASLGDTPAFAAGSADSAMTISAPAGDATALVSGVNGATGIALVEIYDGDTEPASTHLAAISTRGDVGTGGDILIGGLAIGGNTAETVLIQAVGPSLANPPPGTLAQPVLTIYSGSTPIYTNTGWGGDPTIAGVETTVGSTSLVSTNQDSALLITLPPGGYTAEVSGLNSGTGIALIEIYEVP